MSQDTGKTLFGLPIVVTDAVPRGTAIVVRLPTVNEVIEHGSYAAAVDALAEEYGVKAIITGLDDADLNAKEISE